MTNSPDAQLDTLLELEARHDDLLERLSALDKQVEQTIAECMGPHAAATPTATSPSEG